MKRMDQRNKSLAMLIRSVSGVITIVIICYFFPLFHLHHLDEIERKKQLSQFDPSVFVNDFWDHTLLQSLDKAVPVGTLFPLLQQDPKFAKEKYSNSVGIGSLYYYFIRGTGYVHSIHKDHISIVLELNHQEPDILIKTGKIFGNAIRNGTNLIDVSDFPNSREFNQISTHLNKIVENVVIPSFFQTIKVKDQIQFVGCCEIMNEETDLFPLKIVPINVTVE